ncbi:hypothetical protein RRG08_003090 [Elysia crispata]|uniref:Uncharacterized protein n=1 Tax=Elysia crispata TaxID=231223 RepID=A0AAE1EAQ4_9GAST|nr:hypothetical protein RRG08_003090 [Elysia crispata]
MNTSPAKQQFSQANAQIDNLVYELRQSPAELMPCSCGVWTPPSQRVTGVLLVTSTGHVFQCSLKNPPRARKYTAAGNHIKYLWRSRCSAVIFPNSLKKKRHNRPVPDMDIITVIFNNPPR